MTPENDTQDENADNQKVEQNPLPLISQNGMTEFFADVHSSLGIKQAGLLSIWFAARCALRVFPLVWKVNEQSQTFAVLWALTVSRVVYNHMRSHPDFGIPVPNGAAFTAADASYVVSDAARDAGTATAADAAYAAANAAAAADSVFAAAPTAAFAPHIRAVRAAFAAANAARATYAPDDPGATAIELKKSVKDLEWLKQNDYEVHISRPLWHGEDNKITGIYLALKRELEQDPDNVWAFFLEDYDRQLAGETPDWHVLKALAHLDAIEVWQSNDPRQLADYIRQIQEARDAGTDSPSETSDSLTNTLEAIARKTPIGARFRYNPENHLIEEVSLTTSTDKEINHAIYEIGEAQNALSGLSDNLGKLFQPVLAGLNHAIQPENRKATKLFSAAMACQRQIIKICEVNVLGNPKDDPCIHRALSALEIAIDCLHFPEDERPIIDAIIHVQGFTAEPNIKANLEKTIKLAAEISEPELAADIQANHDIVRDPNADETAKRTAWHNKSHWVGDHRYSNSCTIFC